MPTATTAQSARSNSPRGKTRAASTKNLTATLDDAGHFPSAPSSNQSNKSVAQPANRPASTKKPGKPAVNTRPGSERQQNHLLGIVYELISEHGIDAVTMRQVAQASGVSTGTINYHFQNKENLVISALEAAYQLPGDWDEHKGSPAAKLTRLALGYATKILDSRWWCFWINYLAASTRNQQLQAHQEIRFDRQLLFWSDLIAEGIRQGEFKKNIDSTAAATDLLILVHGLLSLQFMKPTAKTRSLAKERILKAIQNLKRN